jgi:hypothetical protein
MLNCRVANWPLLSSTRTVTVTVPAVVVHVRLLRMFVPA